MTVPLLNIATTACVGLLVGSELGLTVFNNPVLCKLDDPAQLKGAHLLTARLMIMPLWNVLGLVLLIVKVVVHRKMPGFSLLVATTALWIAAAVYTFSFMLSLNSRVALADSMSSPKQSLIDYKHWSARHLPRLLNWLRRCFACCS
jgi:uncharacterized membrane protein